MVSGRLLDGSDVVLTLQKAKQAAISDVFVLHLFDACTSSVGFRTDCKDDDSHIRDACLSELSSPAALA